MPKISPNDSIFSSLLQWSQQDWRSYWDDQNEKALNHYPELINAVAGEIVSRNIKRVILIADDRAYFLAALLGGLKASASIVIPQTTSKGWLNEVTEKDDLILTDHETHNSFGKDTISLRHLPFLENTTPQDHPQGGSIIFYTSGSTGHPKPVVKTLLQIENEIKTLNATWGTPTDQGSFLSTVPHHHIYGFLFSLIWPLYCQKSMHRQTFQYWEHILPSMHPQDYLISSPSFLGRFPPTIDASEQPKCSRVFSSGGPLSFEDSQKTNQFLSVQPIEVYGSTETGGIAYRSQTIPQQSWTIFSNLTLKVDDSNRLWIKSPYLATNDFHQTDDEITLFEDGTFHLLGRADRILKIEGKRVSLTEMEKRLTELDIVQEVHITSLQNTYRDELGVVMVLSKQGQEMLRNIGRKEMSTKIRDHLKEYFDLIVIPKKWRFVEHIPLKASGKKNLEDIRHLFMNPIQDIAEESAAC